MKIVIEGIHDYKTSAKNERNGCVAKKLHFIPVRTERHVFVAESVSWGDM